MRPPRCDHWSVTDRAEGCQCARRLAAFYGTELDLRLRRRGVDTILLVGISTNVGVESTARDAYEQVFVEDAMAARSPDEHANTVHTVFPRIGRVRSTAQVLAAIDVATRQA
jgi:nicotinamidase-related amidase